MAMICEFYLVLMNTPMGFPSRSYNSYLKVSLTNKIESQIKKQ